MGSQVKTIVLFIGVLSFSVIFYLIVVGEINIPPMLDINKLPPSAINITEIENAGQSQSQSDGNTSSSLNNIPPSYVVLGLLIIIGFIIFVRRLGKSKSRDRFPFPSYVRKEVLAKQGYKCAICRKSAGVWEGYLIEI